MVTLDDKLNDASKDAQQGAIVLKTLLEACGYTGGEITVEE